MRCTSYGPPADRLCIIIHKVEWNPGTFPLTLNQPVPLLSLASIRGHLDRLTLARAQEFRKYQFADHEPDAMSQSNNATPMEWEESQSFATQAPSAFTNSNAVNGNEGELTDAQLEENRKRAQLVSLLNNRPPSVANPVGAPQTSRDKSKQGQGPAAQEEAQPRPHDYAASSTSGETNAIDQHRREQGEARNLQESFGANYPDADTQSGANESPRAHSASIMAPENVDAHSMHAGDASLSSKGKMKASMFDAEWLEGWRFNADSAAVSKEQQTLLTRNDAWQKPPVGNRNPMGNVPIHIQNEIAAVMVKSSIESNDMTISQSEPSATVPSQPEPDERPEEEEPMSCISWPPTSPVPEAPPILERSKKPFRVEPDLPPDSSLQSSQGVTKPADRPIATPLEQEGAQNVPSSPPAFTSTVPPQEDAEMEMEMEIEVPHALGEDCDAGVGQPISPPPVKRSPTNASPPVLPKESVVQVEETLASKSKDTVEAPTTTPASSLPDVSSGISSLAEIGNSGAGEPSSKNCFMCNKPGHDPIQCPQYPPGMILAGEKHKKMNMFFETTGHCFFCRKKGHSHKNCSDRKCPHCTQQGHHSRNCPMSIEKQKPDSSPSLILGTYERPASSNNEQSGDSVIEQPRTTPVPQQASGVSVKTAPNAPIIREKDKKGIIRPTVTSAARSAELRAAWEASGAFYTGPKSRRGSSQSLREKPAPKPAPEPPVALWPDMNEVMQDVEPQPAQTRGNAATSAQDQTFGEALSTTKATSHPSVDPHTDAQDSCGPPAKRRAEVSPQRTTSRKPEKQIKIKIEDSDEEALEWRLGIRKDPQPVQDLRQVKKQKIAQYREERAKDQSIASFEQEPQQAPESQSHDLAASLSGLNVARSRQSSAAPQSLQPMASTGPSRIAPQQSRKSIAQASSLRHSSSKDSSTIFSCFKQAYPAYDGNAQHFTNLCKQMYELDLEDRMVQKWLWDDYLVRNRIDYTDFCKQLLNRGEDVTIPYIRFYKDHIQDAIYRKGIISNRDVLCQALAELGHEPHVEEEEEQDQEGRRERRGLPWGERASPATTNPVRQSMPNMPQFDGGSDAGSSSSRSEQLGRKSTGQLDTRTRVAAAPVRSTEAAPASSGAGKRVSSNHFRDYVLAKKKMTSWTGSKDVVVSPPPPLTPLLNYSFIGSNL